MAELRKSARYGRAEETEVVFVFLVAISQKCVYGLVFQYKVGQGGRRTYGETFKSVYKKGGA